MENNYKRHYLTQRLSSTTKEYSCVVYIDEPSKYSVVDSNRITNMDDRGYGVIKEFGKSYRIHVDKTGTRESMEKYGQSLENVFQAQMHEEVPSDCEHWIIQKKCQSKTISTSSRSSPKSNSSNKQQGRSAVRKDFSLKNVPFAPSQSSFQSGSFDKTPNSIKRSSSNKQYYINSSSSDEDEGDGRGLSNAEEENFSDYTPPVPERFASTATSTRSSSKSKHGAPVAKRLRSTTDDDDKRDENKQPNALYVLNHVKQLDVNMVKLQKQQEQFILKLDRQHHLLNNLCINQRRLASSFARRKIPINLQGDVERPDTIDRNSIDHTTTYTRADGVVVDLLKISGSKENVGKYVLKAIDSLFIDKHDLQNVNAKKIDHDPRIKAIYAAIMQKFKYSQADMVLIWPSLHDSILSKRRNQKQALERKQKENMFISTNWAVQPMNQNINEVRDEGDAEHREGQGEGDAEHREGQGEGDAEHCEGQGEGDAEHREGQGEGDAEYREEQGEEDEEEIEKDEEEIEKDEE